MPIQEDEKERIDRELIELLNELRVALPGVQVLFAFLLTVPFSNGFSKITAGERAVYFAAFICAMIATALLIAPSAYHRLNFRAPEREKERMLFTANRLSIGGSVFLALAMGAVVYLISDVLYHIGAAAPITGAAAVLFVWFWYVLPLSRRRKWRK